MGDRMGARSRCVGGQAPVRWGIRVRFVCAPPTHRPVPLGRGRRAPVGDGPDGGSGWGLQSRPIAVTDRAVVRTLPTR
jgi:hypothetical protein